MMFCYRFWRQKHPAQINPNRHSPLQHPADLQQCHTNKLSVIDQAVTKAKQAAENQCCQIKCGKVQWCPCIMATTSEILFWKSLLKCESGGKVGLSILHTCTQKAGLENIPYPGKYSLTQLKDLISKAYKHFWCLNQDDSHQDTWITKLITQNGYCGSNYGVQNGYGRWPPMFDMHSKQNWTINPYTWW